MNTAENTEKEMEAFHRQAALSDFVEGRNLMVRNLTLGMTGITVPQNVFRALPIQRDALRTSVYLLRPAAHSFKS